MDESDCAILMLLENVDWFINICCVAGVDGTGYGLKGMTDTPSEGWKLGNRFSGVILKTIGCCLLKGEGLNVFYYSGINKKFWFKSERVWL